MTTTPADRIGTAQIGVVGLAVMGSNLARNFASRGHRVALFNRTPSRTHELMAAHGTEGDFVASDTVEDFVASLERPRRIIMMVQAGQGTDAAIESLLPHLESGDILVDGGNAHFPDTIRREAALKEVGIHFVGAGISGGEEGALKGPAIMPGGPAASYEALGPLLESISAVVDGVPCCTHVGPDGAGHFVKMVHNGIEYADMQLIGEAYQLLRTGLGATPAEIGDIFAEWNSGDLESFLIEITAEVLHHVDAETGRPFVDIIVDQAGQKGTGRWTVQNALGRPRVQQRPQEHVAGDAGAGVHPGRRPSRRAASGFSHEPIVSGGVPTAPPARRLVAMHVAKNAAVSTVLPCLK